MGFHYNAKGINLDTAPITPIPEGHYTLIINEASDIKDGSQRITKNGDPYVNVKCSVDKGEYIGKIIYHNVTFLHPDKNGSGIAIKFLKTIGEPWENEFDVEPSNWIGKTFKAKVIVGKDNKGRSRNEISYLIDELKEDEIPF
ncbi:MAG TPA: hypothetical protein VF974_08090 [Patescibacteria group bacterium]